MGCTSSSTAAAPKPAEFRGRTPTLLEGTSTPEAKTVSEASPAAQVRPAGSEKDIAHVASNLSAHPEQLVGFISIPIPGQTQDAAQDITGDISDVEDEPPKRLPQAERQYGESSGSELWWAAERRSKEEAAAKERPPSPLAIFLSPSATEVFEELAASEADEELEPFSATESPAVGRGLLCA